MARGTPFRRIVLRRLEEGRARACDRLLALRPEQRRVVIFAQGRTGSTLLESLVCSTGHFRQRGEILDVKRRGEVRDPLAFVRGEAKRAGADNFIFHVKLYQLTRDRARPVDPAAFLQALHADGWTIVHLRRANPVRHALSNLVAAARGAHHRFDDRPEYLRIRIEPKDFLRRVGRRKAYAASEQVALGNLPRIEFVYEQDLENAVGHQPAVDRILHATGLPRRPVFTRHRKVNVWEPHEVVENAEEIARLLKARQLGW